MPALSGTRGLDVYNSPADPSQYQKNVQLFNYSAGANQKWYLDFGNGGSYRQVNTTQPNCLGYAMFLSNDLNPNPYFWPNSHITEDFSDKFKGAIEGASTVASCRRISSYNDLIQPNEYRVAIRCPNNLNNNGNIYHVIYQLSDGTWAGKDFTDKSKSFANLGIANPSNSPAMWENDAYSPTAGTIYFAVRKK